MGAKGFLFQLFKGACSRRFLGIYELSRVFSGLVFRCSSLLAVTLAVAGMLEERLVFPGPVLTLPPSPGTQGSPLMLSSPRSPGSTPTPARRDPSLASVPGPVCCRLPLRVACFYCPELYLLQLS